MASKRTLKAADLQAQTKKAHARLLYGQAKGNLSGDVQQRTVPPAGGNLSGDVVRRTVPSKPSDRLTPAGPLTTYGSGRQTNTTTNARAGLKFRNFTRSDRPGMEYHEYNINGKRKVVGVRKGGRPL